MDNFNPKKDRARKVKNDKFHDKVRKKKGNTSQPNKSKPGNANICSKEGNKTRTNERLSSSGSESEENDSQKYARSKIVSNESYYDESLPDFSAEPPAASLEELAAADDVTGGIFQFKGETDWASCPENISNKYFHIDLKKLASGLAAVPFYERVDLLQDSFSSDEKQKMDNEAEKNYKLYTQSLSSNNDIKNLDQLLFKVKSQQNQEVRSQKTVSEPDVDNVSALTAQFKSMRPDLTELLSSKEAQSVAPSPGVKQEKPKESSEGFLKEETKDLDEWLDSILDD